MLRLLLISILLLFTTACTQHHLVVETVKPTKPKAISSETISKIAIPVRENGYNNFKTQVIKTQNELDKFTNDIKQQEGWTQKENFLESLLLKEIDFHNYNLLLYRITESSGSTVLAVDTPLGDEKNITINIGRDKLEVGTSDMAYYTLGYKVIKSVQTITFDNGVKKHVIPMD